MHNSKNEFVFSRVCDVIVKDNPTSELDSLTFSHPDVVGTSTSQPNTRKSLPNDVICHPAVTESMQCYWGSYCDERIMRSKTSCVCILTMQSCTCSFIDPSFFFANECFMCHIFRVISWFVPENHSPNRGGGGLEEISRGSQVTRRTFSVVFLDLSYWNCL